MSRWYRWWASLWNRQESPLSLAWVRIGLSAVIAMDLLKMGALELPGWLWAEAAFGGLWDLSERARPPELSMLFALTPTVAWGLWAVLLGSVACFGAGLFTRLSGLIFLMLYAQSAILNDPSDRAIDRLIRLVFILLIFSRCGDTLSLDARRRTGSFWGDGAPIPSWPRYLIIVQMVMVYWGAGLAKTSIYWFPWGGYSALYVILQDPIYATRDWSFLGHPALFPLTQLGTAMTHLWELSAPILVFAFHYRDTRLRKGRIRSLLNRLDARLLFVGLGVVFHLLLMMSLRLGIFPLAMLSLYPVFFHPDELQSAWRRLRPG
ncbi:MAG: HTTM domain-containing protein [Myxococcota bacterium]